MIYGDNPQKINEREDTLGLKTYTYVPQITAIIQAGNLYVYGINCPLTFFDRDGHFVNMVTGLLVGGLLGGFEAKHNNKSFWQGAIIGAVTGAISGIFVDIAVASGGVSALAIATLGSGISSAAESAAKQVVFDQKSINKLDYSELVVNAISGSVTGLLSFGVSGGSLKKVGGSIWQNMKKNAIDTLMDGTTKTVSKSAVNRATKIVSASKTTGKVIVRKMPETVRRRVFQNALVQVGYAVAISGAGRVAPKINQRTPQ